MMIAELLAFFGSGKDEFKFLGVWGPKPRARLETQSPQGEKTAGAIMKRHSTGALGGQTAGDALTWQQQHNK